MWLTMLGFMVMGLVSGWSLASHSNSVFPGGARIAQPRWVLARGILGSGRTRGVSLRPFPNSSGWWWLISSVFLIRISCLKTTHANGYYSAWPGRAASISVLPRTTASTVSPSICREVTRCHDLSFLNVEFQASVSALLLHP